jgi:hypothetical protein
VTETHTLPDTHLRLAMLAMLAMTTDLEMGRWDGAILRRQAGKVGKLGKAAKPKGLAVRQCGFHDSVMLAYLGMD